MLVRQAAVTDKDTMYVYLSTNKFYLQPSLFTQIPDPVSAVKCRLQASDMIHEAANHRLNSSTLPL